VFINQTFSEIIFITAGVPQGSVLGPLLFLIYVNDIFENLLSLTRLFADDTSLAVTSSDISETETLLNHDLNILNSWSKQWLVQFNPSKTEGMMFTLSNSNTPVITFDNTTVNFIDNHKHLGLTLSSDPSWHSQSSEIRTLAMTILGSMKALEFKLNKNT